MLTVISSRSRKVNTQADFEDDRLDLRFRIHPERMHRGKNLGAIRLHGPRRYGDPDRGNGRGTGEKRAEGEISKAGVCRYMKLREAYESGLYDKNSFSERSRMSWMRSAAQTAVPWILSLLQAETYLDAEDRIRQRYAWMIPGRRSRL